MFTHLKRRVGVLSAVAVMAALLPVLTASVASAIPATALAPKAVDDGATYSACPSGSAAAAGFTDTTSTDVDCIAMYGITTGVTATTYEPTANVPRWQMALYLTRMVTAAGVALGSGADQGFTDISGYSAAIQTAINQIKQLGVTVGKTATTYAPDDNVTREEMALFLDRALAATPAGPGGISAASGNSLLGLNVNSDSTGTGEYNYDDIDGGSVTFEGHNSIVEIYQLGITGDLTTVRAFNPSSAITRATMATWVTNALAHTNARPAGLWLQSAKYAGFANATPSLSASYRDSDRNPVAGKVVDFYSWENAATVADNSAHTAAGACATATALAHTSLTKCKVEVGDPTTNTQGNIPAWNSAVTAGKTMSYFAWSAAAGTTFVLGTHGSGTEYSTIDISSTAPATLLVLSTDTPAGASVAADPYASKVKYGSTVTITAQMSATKVGTAWPAVAQPLNKVTFTHTIHALGTNTVESVTTTNVLTDASGTATYSFTDADPLATASTGATRHKVVVSDAGGMTETSAALANTAAGWFEGGTTAEWSFDDAAAAINSTSMATNQTSYKAGSALLPVARSATVTLLDQYGSTFVGSTGTNVQFTGASVGRLASTTNGDETMTFAAAPGLDVGDQVVIVELGSTPQTLKEDCTLTLKTRTSNVAMIFKTVAGDAGVGASAACGAAAADPFLITGGDISGAAAGTWLVNELHDTFGFADRAVGPDGTANIAWNDVTSTAGVSGVGAYVAALGNVSPNKTTYRWIAPATTVLVNSQTSAIWTETSAGSDDLADAASDIVGQIVEWDNTNNTLTVQVDYATGGCSYDSLLAAVGCSRTVTQYSYDANDQFNLTEGTTSTTLAGFEAQLTLHLVATAGVRGAAGVFAAGDIDTVSYQALADNVSIFSLGT